MKSIIHAEQLSHVYETRTGEQLPAISEIDFEVRQGEFVAIVGHNGSGKSTLAKHFNALLLPTSGRVWIDGLDSSEPKNLWPIRQRVGMVFQNPDNQIVATTVEEDVAFGPENLGVPSDEIGKRIEESLRAVEMLEYREHAPHRLSGGQKQRVAIAGVIAMRPLCLVLDEPTAMLDPGGRGEVLATVKRLNREEGITVVLITHFMEEAAMADRIVVMESGHIVLEGPPESVYSAADKLRELHLDVPPATELAQALRKAGLPIEGHVMSVAQLADQLSHNWGAGRPASQE